MLSACRSFWRHSSEQYLREPIFAVVPHDRQPYARLRWYLAALEIGGFMINSFNFSLGVEAIAIILSDKASTLNRVCDFKGGRDCY